MRFGIIGCGDIAIQEAEAIRTARNTDLVMVMDVNKVYAENLAKEYGVPFTVELKELLGRKDIDAVVISAPNHLHAPITIETADSGKHVVVEKPMAMDRKEADSMIHACAKSGVKLSVAYCLRYWPWIRKARELIQRGTIGEITSIMISSMSMKPDAYWSGGYSKRVTTQWRRDRNKSGGGVFAMNVTHSLDYIYHITGLEVERIYAEYDTLATDVEVEDTISAVLRYTNGAIGCIEASSAAPGGSGNGERIYGAEGQIILAAPLRVYVVRSKAGFAAKQWHDVNLPELANKWIDPRRMYFEEFADSVGKGEEPPVLPEDGRRGVELICAAYQSGEAHVPVSLQASQSPGL